MGDWVQGVAQGGGRGQGEPVHQHPCPLPTGPLPEPVANGDIEKVRVVFMYLIFKSRCYQALGTV